MKPSVLEIRRVEALENISKLLEMLEGRLAKVETKLDELRAFVAASQPQSRPPANTEVRRGK